jgi:hypothetical protein
MVVPVKLLWLLQHKGYSGESQEAAEEKFGNHLCSNQSFK